MTIVIGDITMSLDGFVTGPGADLEHGLGRDGERLHAWALQSQDPVDRGILERHTRASGAVVMGRRTFDTVDGSRGWSAERGYGADQDGRTAFFVITSTQPWHVRLAGTHDFTFVLDGPAAAVQQAKAAAGDRDVFVMGGGRTVAGCLAAGLLDQLRIHLAPELMGSGTPLFGTVGSHRLRQVGVEASPAATHLTYDVLPG